MWRKQRKTTLTSALGILRSNVFNSLYKILTRNSILVTFLYTKNDVPRKKCKKKRYLPCYLPKKRYLPCYLPCYLPEKRYLPCYLPEKKYLSCYLPCYLPKKEYLPCYLTTKNEKKKPRNDLKKKKKPEKENLPKKET